MNTNNKARYEFRIFGQGFGRETDEIRQRSACNEIEEVLDFYLVTTPNDINNVKIRNKSLGIKVLLSVENCLELWQPSLKLDFPMAASVAGTETFRALAVETPHVSQTEIDMQGFMRQIIHSHPEVWVAAVFKRRSHFQVGRCMVEIDELLVNGAAIQSISLECDDAAEVLRVRQLLDMQRYPNTSYLLALKRIMGIVPPLPQSWLLAS